MAIKFSREAENDLLGIFRYGIQHYGLARAEHYKRELDKSFRLLSDHPRMARLRYEIAPPVRIMPAQRHLIVYTLLEEDETVFVLRIRHQHENWIEQPQTQARRRRES